jgi:hypothetical protein
MPALLYLYSYAGGRFKQLGYLFADRHSQILLNVFPNDARIFRCSIVSKHLLLMILANIIGRRKASTIGIVCSA